MNQPSAHAYEPVSAGAEGDLAVATNGMLKLVEQAGAHAASLHLVVPGEPSLVLAAIMGLSREFARPWLRVSLTAPIPMADSLRIRQVVYILDEEEMARRYPDTALALPYKFTLCVVPLVTDSAAYGCVTMLISGPRPPRLPDAERDRLFAIATEAAERMEAAERAGSPVRPGPVPLMVAPPGYTGLGTETDAVAAMARLPEGLCSLDMQGRLAMVTPVAEELLGRPAHESVDTQFWTALPWLRNPVYEDRYRSAMFSRRPASFVALRPPDRWLSFQLFPDATGTTVRICPVQDASRPPDGPPPPGRPAASRPGGVGAEDVGQVTPTRVGAIYHVLRLASSLAQAASVQDVVDLVGEQILPAFGGNALMMLTADRGGWLSVAGVSGYPAHVVSRLVSVPVTACTPRVRTLLLGRPTFIESRRELPDEVPHDGMCAWAFLPLIASGRPVGTCVLAFAEPHRFTAEERAVLTSLVGLIAQALERARMFDSKQALVRGLQAGLLPHALPRVPGLGATARYLPSTEDMDVGGDFYDLIRLDDGTVAAVIGDVQGHNVSAAALMGQVRTAVRAYATAGEPPSQVLANTNRLLTDLDPGLFASCVYLHLDLRGRKASVARAGHPMPLLRTPGEPARVVDVPGGLLLGIDPAAEYPGVVVPLPPGSVLALYTDGLVETPGGDIDEAAADLAARLDRAAGLPLDDLAETLVEPVRQAGRRADDVALLVLEARAEAATMP